MNYCFNTEIAKKYGVDGAIIIQNIFYFVQKNKANKEYLYDGYYWTQYSNGVFENFFPFWTKQYIEKIIKNLEKEGAILTNSFNNIKCSEKNWFALSDDIICIYEKEKPQYL